ncbi:hypothetical protein RSAG8_12258, partial [Rhizoctonia solani AG-8 WAC10335]
MSTKIVIRFPTEILAIITQYASIDTLPHLSLVSRKMYFITIPVLYASIPDLCMPRTIRCLLTLSTKPEVAHLVRSFSVDSPCSYALRAFHSLLTRALSNMTGLRRLSIQSDIAISGVLSQMSCRLTELDCFIPPGDSYFISKFLSTQPAIEKLTINCSPDDLSTLDPEALPALRELAAPIHLLPTFLISRLPHIPRLPQLSQLCVFMLTPDLTQFLQLARALKAAKLPKSLKLIIKLLTTIDSTMIGVVSLG